MNTNTNTNDNHSINNNTAEGTVSRKKNAWPTTNLVQNLMFGIGTGIAIGVGGIGGATHNWVLGSSVGIGLGIAFGFVLQKLAMNKLEAEEASATAH